MWQDDFEIELIQKRILAQKDFYLKGFYRKPYEALLKVLIK
jgi:hypothetical protein